MRSKNKTLDSIRDEEEIISAAQALKSEAENAASKRHKQIKKCWQFYFGNQWLNKEGKKDKRAPSWRYRGKLDVCFRTVENIRPVLQSGIPNVFVSPDFDIDEEAAEAATEIINAEREYRMEEIEHGKAVLEFVVAGISIRKSTFDFGRNVVISPSVNPLRFFPDPYGTDPNFADHKYIIHEVMMDAADIERRFSIKESDFGSESGAGSGIFNLTRKIFNQKGKSEYKRRRYPVWDIYYSEATPEVIMDTENEPKSLKHPNGRHIIIVNKKKVALDQDNWNRRGDFPFTAYQDYTIPRKFWSLGEIDHLMSTQVNMNVLFSQMMMNAILTANTQWIMPKGAVPHGTLTNEPGLIVSADRSMIDEIRRLEPSTVSPAYSQILSILEEQSQRTTSVSEVVAGREPSSGTSGVAIQQLQNMALGRQRFKMINIDSAMRRQAKLEFELLQDYANFRDPRYTRKLGLGEWLNWTDDIRDLAFDINIESKAGLPHNLVGKINFATTMLEQGVFDHLQFLEFTGIPVREELKQLLQQQFNMALTQMGIQPEGQATGGAPSGGKTGGTPSRGKTGGTQGVGIPRMGQGFEGGEEAVLGGAMA